MYTVLLKIIFFAGSVNLPLHEIPEAFELSPQQFEGRYLNAVIIHLNL